MEYDKDKVDELTLALLFLGMSRMKEGGRAWRGFDQQTLARLHQRGWIGDPMEKGTSIGVSAEGMKKAAEFFKKHFQSP
mgnify:CR=1 FL=1